MKCKFCGHEVQQPKRGRRKNYCDRAECIKKARNEARKKWYAKKVRTTLKGAKNRIVDRTNKPIVTYQSKNTVKKDRDVINDVSELLEIAREYGTLRFRLIEMKKKALSETEEHNKQTGATFFHKLELMSDDYFENMSGEKAKAILTEERNLLKNRRPQKNKLILIEAMLNSILIKNPSAFIGKAVQEKGDITQAIKELKKDEALYDKKKIVALQKGTAI